MSTRRNINVSARRDEGEVVRRWWMLQPGSLLPLSNGELYVLVFHGHTGGAAGPDIRDAVFARFQRDLLETTVIREQLVGDVEFHVHAEDWVAHQHHRDTRYNQVILHVVLFYKDTRVTIRQDGQIVPVCTMYDLPATSFQAKRVQASWPCQQVQHAKGSAEMVRLLRQAGLQRFEQKMEVFVEQVRALERLSPAHPDYQLYDWCLIPALAEGLGYGRDRAFFRAAGQRLLGLPVAVPEPLGDSGYPAPLDTSRLRVLRVLVERWCMEGAWNSCRTILNIDEDTDLHQILDAMRTLFTQAGLSLARADILICNVVLPFAAAVALIEQEMCLFERARELYLYHPGLSSNRITRLMCRQLLLFKAPWGACAQQGLQYIYQQTCREKLCIYCVFGARV